MPNARLPDGWEYTGKTLQRNIESGGILHHFYWASPSEEIYEVMGTQRGRHRRAGFHTQLLTKYPRRGQGFTRCVQLLDDLFHDKEVRRKS